ncbi:MAG TPA: FAD-binding oxidoreductase [Aldersonia sp.]
MAQAIGFDLGTLRSAMRGPVLGPGDADYDAARAIWNGDIDKRPAAFARAAGPDDVVAALAFARENGLEISVRGGGHGYSGSSLSEGGLTIDLSALDQVTVDSQARTARVGGGAALAQLDAAAQAHGLAVPAGVISHTGVGGLTLGGGMGWLTHLHGLAIDNLASAEVVLADGRTVRASERDHPDLFWALRGGGGNFGVVTEFEFRLHEVGPEVYIGLFFWGADDGPAALRLCREFVATLPPRAGVLIAAALTAPPAPFVPEQYHFTPGHALIVAGFGTASEHADLVEPIRRQLPPLFEFVAPIPYAGLQQMLDDAAPWGAHAYEKSLDFTELTDEVIEVLTEHAAQKTSPLSFIPIFALDGAFSAVPEDATAFGGSRRPHFTCSIEACAPDPAMLPADRLWVRSTWDALRGLASNTGGYVNFMTDLEQDRVRASYGSAKYERLARIKAEYDPDNVFHLNANIKPA